MKITPIASSSAGNAYLIDDGKTRILIDCGVHMNRIMAASDWMRPPIDACLLTHSHGDHSASVKYLLHKGILCYMGAETAKALRLNDGRSRIRGVRIFGEFETEIGTFIIKNLEMVHDVECYGFYIYSMHTRESLFFATDTNYIPYNFGLASINYIMIEANHDRDVINRLVAAGDMPEAAARRTMETHMSIDTTLLWLSRANLSKTRRIYLLHLSGNNSTAEDFKRRVVEQTGIPTVVCPE